MHDPLVVAFDIRRPWPKRDRMPASKVDGRWSFGKHRPAPGSPAEAEAIATGRNPFPWWKPSSWSPFWVLAGRRFYFPSLITIWHVEPGGQDSGEVCKHYHRYRDAGGKWRSEILHGWKWHVHHWRIQVHPLQQLRRWALTRCEWCGGRSRKGDYVNVSRQWRGDRGPWWRGERGLYHVDCSSVAGAHAACLCEAPHLELGMSGGRCARCGNFRRYGATPAELQRQRLLASVPKGKRDATIYGRVCELAKEDRR